MKVPLSWLREYVDLTIPVADLVERLTLAFVKEIANLFGAVADILGAKWRLFVSEGRHRIFLEQRG